MIAKYHFETDVPLYHEAERVQWDEWYHTDQSRSTHLRRQQRLVNKFPETDVCTQDLHIEIKKKLVCWTPPCTTPLNPMTSISLCRELRYHVRLEYEYCDVCVNRSDDNVLHDCFQVSQRLSDPKTTPQTVATWRLSTLPIELINDQRDTSVAGYKNATYPPLIGERRKTHNIAETVQHNT